MHLQNVESFWEMQWAPGMAYAELVRQGERQWSTYNFEQADVAAHFARFDECEKECKRLLGVVADPAKKLVLPAYDFVIKGAHAFNVLDARGAIGVTERQRFIGRARAMAKAVAEAWLAQRESLGFPLLKTRVAASSAESNRRG